MLMCGELYASRGWDWYNTSVFFRLMVRAKFWAVSEKVGAFDANVWRIVCLTWRGLVQHLSLLQADGEGEVLGCIREAVDDVL